MLRGLDPILGPDLLHALRAMGHGDEICIVDANFPAVSNAKRLIRIDAADAVQVADAILSLMPLDTFVDNAAFVMQVVGKPKEAPPIYGALPERDRQAREGLQDRAHRALQVLRAGAHLLRHRHYGERRFYGNLILTKGVVPPK